jgi:hypothetical protein
MVALPTVIVPSIPNELEAGWTPNPVWKFLRRENPLAIAGN